MSDTEWRPLDAADALGSARPLPPSSVRRPWLRGAFLLAACAFLAVCGLVLLSMWDRPPPWRAWKAMTFAPEGESLVVNGTTKGNSLKKFRRALEDNPGTRVVVLNIVGGSDNDTVNLKMAKLIREQGLATHLTSKSVIESGGIELFMGGVERTTERGARVGVHSWSDDDEGYEGRDLPRDHRDHRPYLNAYRELGIPDSFYWFTLDAAPATGMHFMTDDELYRFKLLTAPIGTAPS